MPLTLPDLYELLINVDEITLLEVLNISSEDIVDRFKDVIDNKADELEQEFNEGIDE